MILIYNIQALRALAAFLVVFVHLDDLLKTLGAGAFGNGGVDLFFVISGFIMVHTTRQAPPTPATFMTHRVIRVVPLYWMITLAVFGLALFAPSLMGATQADPMQLLKSLLFVPFLKANGLVQPVLFVGWTLNYEMFFYALFALGLFLKDARKGLWLTIGLILALVAVGAAFEPQGVLAQFYTSSLMLEFVFGMALAMAFDRLPVRGGLMARYVVAAVLALALAVLISPPAFAETLPRAVFAGAPAMVIVLAALLLERWGWRAENGVLTLLGSASYALYLSHPFVTQVAQKAGLALGPTGLMSLAILAMTLAGAWTVAMGVYALVEKPMTDLLRGRRPWVRATA